MIEFREKYINPFEVAEIAKFTPEQVRSYEDSLKYYRDIKASLDTKFEDGKIEGKIEVAEKLLKKGMSIENIIDLTGLTKEQIKKLK